MRERPFDARLVLVEDNPADVALLRYALAEHGFTGTLATLEDGEAALAWVDAGTGGSALRPDLILLDLHLPRHDGLTVLLRLKASAMLAGVPVAVLTSSTDPGKRAQAVQAGVAHYAVKPLDWDDFVRLGAAIRHWCEGAQVAGQSA